MDAGRLERVPVPFEKVMSSLEEEVMSEIVRAIKINGFSTSTADFQMRRLIQMGQSEERIKEYVRKALEMTDAELENVYSDEIYRHYYGYSRAYSIKGLRQIPFAENLELQMLIKAVKKQTGDTFNNITGSMGFAVRNAAGRTDYRPLRDFYRRTLDDAVMGIISGTQSYSRVLSRAVDDMTAGGLRWIDYESGWHNRVDVAARRAVMTGFRQVQGKINEQAAADLGTDSYEVTRHAGARPEHQVWQGRVYTYKELESICGLGSVTGLHGANCYHDYNAFIPGISVRTYTDEQLDRMNEEENTPKAYGGGEYTAYEALQKQRKMERAMRKTRQDIKLLEEGEADKKTVTIKKGRYQLQQQYKAFSKAMNLPEQMDRVYLDGLGRTGAAKGVAKPRGSGIIKPSNAKEDVDVHTVGRIDRNIYKCITDDIVTDEVIITDDQIQHIKERHPDDYERFSQYFSEIVREPDFIIESKKKNTALILKEIQTEHEVFKTVLRLITSEDAPEYKNSIITFMKIDEKEWNRLLRNKKVLYKKG